MACCVVVHASGVTWALRHLRSAPFPRPTFWRSTWTCIGVAAWMIVCHLAEIAVWALVYFWTAAMPDPQSAFYFSAVTYTTTGYGDLVLPPDWRMAGAVEALTGILLCGWSTAFFFAVLSRLYAVETPDGRRGSR
jgi:hypothetical protein